MDKDIKKWLVKYDHHDGRAGATEVMTEIQKGEGFQYGNGKVGAITVGTFTQVYDLRYVSGDLHMQMLKEYFGTGLITATEFTNRTNGGRKMRIVRQCGYDGTVCEKYPVKLDDKGYVQEEEIKCTLNDCEHCYFTGKPWTRTGIIMEELK